MNTPNVSGDLLAEIEDVTAYARRVVPVVQLLSERRDAVSARWEAETGGMPDDDADAIYDSSGLAELDSLVHAMAGALRLQGCAVDDRRQALEELERLM